jgi:hypothetical protein
MPAPMPLDAPVITATLPVSLLISLRVRLLVELLVLEAECDLNKRTARPNVRFGSNLLSVFL